MDFAENWDRATAKGEVDSTFIKRAKDVLGCSSGINGIRISIYDSPTDYASLIEEGFLESHAGAEWTATITKKTFLESLFESQSINRFIFFKEDIFLELTSSLDPFDAAKNPLLENENPIQIFCSKIKKPFGGPRIAFFPSIEKIDKAPKNWPQQHRLPSKDTINSTIHIAAKFDCKISPASFYLDWGDTDSAEAKAIRLLSAKTLSATLCHDFFSEDRVTLDGIKRRDIPLSNKTDSAPSTEKLEQIAEAVKWVYEERTGTRSRLLADRLSLDIRNHDSFTSGLTEHISEALQQSKSKYQFIILERKNDYASELSSLLKDLRIQADLFSSKLRSLTSGLTRDTLATLTLISVTLISRMGDNSKIFSSQTADALLKSLAIYIFISAGIQGVTAYLDTKSSWKELAYWKGVLREHMGLEEIDTHIRTSLKFRRISFGIIHGILLTLYGVIGLIAWNFSLFFSIFSQ
ncbi:MAG: hypothetical protein ACJA0B_001501 [Alcanivorax borkumensis]|uniref:hypothetical protein n=1 Tax=Alcanivorax borkumensis TaxID=59754 RepID=UPI003EEE4495